MKRKKFAFLLACIFIISAPMNVLASMKFPSSSDKKSFQGKEYIIYTYEVDEKKDTYPFIEDKFVEGGFEYVLDSVDVIEKSKTEKKVVTETREVSATSKDGALSLFEENIDYENNEESEPIFTGSLKKVDSSFKIDMAGYRNHSSTVTETTHHYGLHTADTSSIPKSISKNSVTLALKDIDWIPVETPAGESYNATAYYTGTSTKSVASGYIASIIYEGEVERKIADGYTLKAYYTGVFIPEPVLEPDKSGFIDKERVIELAPFIIGGLFFIAIIFIAIYLLLLPNTKIYNMQDGVYKLVGRQRILASEPIINLNQVQAKSTSSIYNIVISKQMTTKLLNKSVTVRLGKKEVEEYISSTGIEHSFEVSLTL